MSSSKMMNDIYLGWSLAAMRSPVRNLGVGGIANADVKVRVDGDHAPGAEMGDPFLAWAPASLLSKQDRCVQPCDNLPLWRSINSSDQSHMKTLAMLSRSAKLEESGQEKITDYAFIVAGLRMLWGYRGDIAASTHLAFQEFCKYGGFQQPDEIWGPGKWKTLPEKPGKTVYSLTGDGHEIGRFLRGWHDRVFTRFYAVEARPVAADSSEDAPFQCLIDVGVSSPILEALCADVPKGRQQGSDEWQNLSKKDLERLVWTHPRQQLAGRFNVSDMAITKRCKRLEISRPPRGFWQKARMGDEAAISKFLKVKKVVPPSWWTVADIDKGEM